MFKEKLENGIKIWRNVFNLNFIKSITLKLLIIYKK